MPIEEESKDTVGVMLFPYELRAVIVCAAEKVLQKASELGAKRQHGETIEAYTERSENRLEMLNNAMDRLGDLANVFEEKMVQVTRERYLKKGQIKKNGNDL